MPDRQPVAQAAEARWLTVEAKIIDEMMKGLRCAKALLDNINEFGACTSPEIYDAADTAVRAALAARLAAPGHE